MLHFCLFVTGGHFYIKGGGTNFSCYGRGYDDADVDEGMDVSEENPKSQFKISIWHQIKISIWQKRIKKIV